MPQSIPPAATSAPSGRFLPRVSPKLILRHSPKTSLSPACGLGQAKRAAVRAVGRRGSELLLLNPPSRGGAARLCKDTLAISRKMARPLVVVQRSASVALMENHRGFEDR